MGYNMSALDAAGLTTLGIKVEKATSNNTTTTDLFDIEVGNVLVNLIVGEVTQEMEATTSNYALKADPDTGTTNNMCGNLDVTGDKVGTLYTIAGAIVTALQEGGTGSVACQDFPIVVAPGAIECYLSATNTGYIKWTLWYVPLETGAYVAAA